MGCEGSTDKRKRDGADSRGFRGDQRELGKVVLNLAVREGSGVDPVVGEGGVAASR